jgi:allantoin racemase
MEILYLLPGDGMPDDELGRRKEVANSISRPDVNMSVMEVGEGPLSIESAIEEYMSIGPMLVKMLEIRDEGKYDAIIIGCAGDPGLKPARELMDIPVIGPAESAYLFACMVSDRFSVLSTMHAGVASDDDWRVKLRAMGLESRLASVEFVRIPITEMWGKNKDVVVKYMVEGVENAKQAGAGSIVLGCMSMAFLLIDELSEEVGLPIINPLKTAIKTAEMFVDLGAKHSEVTYHSADFEKLMGTVFPKD